VSVRKILEDNAKFLKKYKRIKVPDSNNWAIVTCCDRRLSGLLEAAMGFRPGEAHMIRTTGAIITSFDNSIIRSLSLLVLHENVKEIAVIGHTNCLCGTNSGKLTRLMDDAGVDRQLAGSDLREFFGLSDNQTAAIRKTVDGIAKSGFIPTGVNIHGLLIDTSTVRISHICSHTVEKIDLPNILESKSYRKTEDTRVQKIATHDRIRGQEMVRQFEGRIEVPKKVHTSVESVKVPVNIRTHVQEIHVPTKIGAFEGNIKVPTEVKMPEKAINLDLIGKKFEHMLEQKNAKKESETRKSAPAARRGQSQGSWKTSPSRARTPERPQPAERKYCPQCGAEYYPHVERCADCRVRLVSKDRYLRERKKKLKPVLDPYRAQRSKRDERGRSLGNFYKRR